MNGTHSSNFTEVRYVIYRSKDILHLLNEDDRSL